MQTKIIAIKKCFRSKNAHANKISTENYFSGEE